METLLEVKELGKKMSGQMLFDAVSFSLKEGERLGVVGENGTGKSTFLNTLSNLLKHDSGDILLNKEVANFYQPWQMARAGFGRSFQNTRNINILDVKENLLICGRDFWRSGILQGFARSKKIKNTEREILNAAASICEELGMDLTKIDSFLRDSQKLQNLSLGEQRLVELVRLFLTDPAVFLLDEPTVHLNAKICDNLSLLIKQLSVKGTAFIIVSHDTNFLIKNTDRLLIFEAGRKPYLEKTLTYFNKLSEIAKPNSYRMTTNYHGSQTPILQVTNLTVGYNGASIIKDINFSVRKGEIVLITGKNGSGKSTFVKTLIGELPSISGDIFLSGKSVNQLPVHDRITTGLSYVFQDKRIFPRLTVLENLKVAFLGNKQQLSSRINHSIEQFPVLCKILDKPASLLSGGEQQILALARVLMQNPEIILLDEPFSGMSEVNALKSLSNLEKLLSLGIGIILIEHNSQIINSIRASTFTVESGRFVRKSDG